jgi:exonuclease III
MANVMKHFNNIALACWNIDGLFARIEGQRFCKLNDDSFLNAISMLDIVCLIETHCGPQENLTLDGFQVYHKHRPKSPNATKHFGGIAICVRD